MPMGILLLLFFFNLSFFLPHESHASSMDGCPTTCGSIDIPYPFGIGENCSLSKPYQISCLQTPTQTPYIYNQSYQVLSISNGNIRANSSSYINSYCVDLQHRLGDSYIRLPRDGPFTISSRSNVVVVVGCKATGGARGWNELRCDEEPTNTDSSMNPASGCNADNDHSTDCPDCSQHPVFSTLCNTDPENTGLCSGVGSCEAAILHNTKYMEITNFYTTCSYVFIVEKGGFLLKPNTDIKTFSPDIAMVLDWSVGNRSCSNVTLNICGENSVCADSDTGTGYLCKCIQGYEGNAYLNGSKGCTDINECLITDHKPCVDGATCINTTPSYKCQCPHGNIGDGKVNGSGCRKKKTANLKLVLGIVVGIINIAGLLCFWLLYLACKKYKQKKLKEEYFRKNGGLTLKKQLSGDGGNDRGRIFSAEELGRATSNYCDSKVLGSGGSGTVYKGVLKDGSLVAIKISKFMDQLQIDRFINEFVILTEINHKNIVRLLGCCLENEMPILVYEFISNGTLHSHIHESLPGRQLSWSKRLKIATEIAEALSYLHSSASTPIFHRDVKPANILIDEDYSAKIADFGISKFVPLDQTQASTLMQGTPGYLDPEFYMTYQLTEKSDVYSFGVLLVELLTGQLPISLDRPSKSSCLAMYFIEEMKNNDLSSFVDKNLLREGCIEEIEAVCDVAWKCLLPIGEERPTMKEIALELSGIASHGRQRILKEDAYEDSVYDSVSEGDVDELQTGGELP